MSDEEDVYVEIDLEGIVEKQWLSRIGDSCKFVGMDTDAPFLQLGPYSFQGKYSDSIGTSVFFEEATEDHPQLRLKCHTYKKIDMKRCFLTRKTMDQALQPTGDVQNEDDDENHETTTTRESDINPHASTKANITPQGRAEARADESSKTQAAHENVEGTSAEACSMDVT